MNASDAGLSIGELAARFELATHVLRHWETVGVLIPTRRVNGQRRYSREHIAQVMVILAGKEAGFSLEGLRDILHTDDADTRRDILRRHAADLDTRIERLRTARQIIEHPLRCPSGDFFTCPDFRAGVQAALAGECVHSPTSADPLPTRDTDGTV